MQLTKHLLKNELENELVFILKQNEDYLNESFLENLDLGCCYGLEIDQITTKGEIIFKFIDFDINKVIKKFKVKILVDEI